MSQADTAEYQLNRLAEAMNDAITEASATTEWQSKEYRDGFDRAISEIAEAMGIGERKVYSLRKVYGL